MQNNILNFNNRVTSRLFLCYGCVKIFKKDFFRILLEEIFNK